MGNLAIFIDAGYFKKLAEFVYKKFIDYEKFSNETYALIKGKTETPLDLLRTYYYDAIPYQSNPPTPEETDRFSQARKRNHALNRLPKFTVREGRLEPKGFDSLGNPIFQQKRIDLMLGLDIANLSLKGKITHMVLVSGDSDLIPAIEVVKNEGISAWLFHGPYNGKSFYAQELWDLCDKRFEMDQAFINKCELIRR